jgi:hypothetical protein
MCNAHQCWCCIQRPSGLHIIRQVPVDVVSGPHQSPNESDKLRYHLLNVFPHGSMFDRTAGRGVSLRRVRRAATRTPASGTSTTAGLCTGGSLSSKSRLFYPQSRSRPFPVLPLSHDIDSRVIALCPSVTRIFGARSRDRHSGILEYIADNRSQLFPLENPIASPLPSSLLPPCSLDNEPSSLSS